ncbi:BglG family transcription antiterminator [Alicyclobacillus curvatus]|nr:BglG family transcription antiterminator [Alicyclobacillus curvatus]
MAAQLTERQKHILYLLLETSAAVNMDELVRRLQVSRRTVQRDVNTMQGYLNTFGVVLRVLPDRLSLEGPSDDVLRMRQQTGKLPSTLTLAPRDRELHVAMDLLLEEGPSKLRYFGRQLQVTAASLSQSMDEVEAWLQGRGLRLIRKRGYGIEIDGDEAARREAIVELVYGQVDVPDLIALMQTANHGNSLLSAWFTRWFSHQRVDKVHDVLTEELAGSNPPLDEAAFYGFMLHVLLSVARIEQGASVQESEDAPAQLTQDVQTCSRILERLVGGARHLQAESAYLAKHLRGAKVLMTDESRILPLNITAMDLSYRMVKHLEETLRMSLAWDHALIAGMSQHLEPSLHRMKMGLVIRNPLLAEIQRHYPSFFEAMRDASDAVLKPYGLVVPDEEIGYLTMHLGASIERQRAERKWRTRIVCLNGISSAELLASRVQKEFPQLEIVSLGALEDADTEPFDLTLSTVPLRSMNKPVVTVSPFLTAEERQKVQSVLATLETNNAISPPRPTNDLPPDGVQAVQLSQMVGLREVSCQSMAELVQQISEEMAAEGVVTNRDVLAATILEREQMGSIVLPGKGLSVLHTRTDVLTRPQIRVYRLSTAVEVQGVANTTEIVDTVLVLLARMSESPSTIRLLGRLSSSLVTDADMVDVLRSGGLKTVQRRILQSLDKIEE